MEQTGVNGGKKAADKSRMKQLIKSKLLITEAKCCRHFVVYILPVKTFKGYRTNQTYDKDIRSKEKK
jgi:hypothetical protein